MSTTAAGTCVLIVACFVSAVHYEDDARNFARQRIAEVLEIRDMVFVKSRNFLSNSILLCHAFRRERQLSDDEFQYTMFLSPQPPQGEYILLSTVFTLFATPPHMEANAVSILIEQLNGHPSLFKLMYINLPRSCFILVRKRWGGRRECLLLQTIYSIQERVPRDCHNTYLLHCPGQKYALYRPQCRALIRRNRRPGS